MLKILRRKWNRSYPGPSILWNKESCRSSRRHLRFVENMKPATRSQLGEELKREEMTLNHRIWVFYLSSPGYFKFLAISGPKMKIGHIRNLRFWHCRKMVHILKLLKISSQGWIELSLMPKLHYLTSWNTSKTAGVVQQKSNRVELLRKRANRRKEGVCRKSRRFGVNQIANLL